MVYHREYRDLWTAADYPGNMGSAAVVTPPPSDYIAAYHFAEAEHAIDDIKNKHIKLARISQLNDPFELLGVKFKDGRLQIEVRNHKIESDAKSGLLCFSQNWISPALWSHYADRHKGICLGFHAKRTTIEHVKYEHDRIDANTNVADLPSGLTPQLIEQLKRTKAHDWLYEQEIRRFVELNEAKQVGNLHFFNFDDTLKLTEIILGDSCKLKLQDVRSTVSRLYKNVAVYEARLAYGFFAVVPHEQTIP